MRYKKEAPIQMTIVTLLLVVGSALVIGGCASTKVSDTSPLGVNFSGTWVLNSFLSDNTDSMITMAIAQSRESRITAARGGKGGGMRGGRGGEGSGRRGGRGGNRKADQARPSTETLRQIAAELLPNSSHISIQQLPTSFQVQYDNQQNYQHLYGEQITISLAGFDVERITGWQGDQYIVETKTANGSTFTERFAMANGGKQMRLSLTIESKRFSEAITVTKVFDQSSPHAPSKS